MQLKENLTDRRMMKRDIEKIQVGEVAVKIEKCNAGQKGIRKLLTKEQQPQEMKQVIEKFKKRKLYMILGSKLTGKRLESVQRNGKEFEDS